ncbi:MAG: L,D-transpeptidase family protein [Synergistes sp.]|nr:L,D-transpeptidase family protein [Synergistes sp.]
MSKSIRKIIVVTVCVFCSLFAAAAFGAEPIWNSLLRKYRADETVRTLIFVQHTEGSNAQVLLYQKDRDNSDAWTLMLQCEGVVGKNGISDNRHEGDGTTPIGDFGVIEAIGIKKKPKTTIPYRTADNDLFCSGNYDETYNKIVSKKEIAHVCNEGCAHLYETSPQFNYSLFLDFNKECVVGKGSGIFFHCFGPNPYTAGCIAVSEENMKRILQLADKNLRVCIFPKY